MKMYSIEQIQQIVQEFDSQQLAKPDWDHQAHLLVAFWYNWHLPFQPAFETVKEKIISYNTAVGTPNTDESGYHETITRFWMILTRNYLEEGGFDSLEQAYNTFLQSRWATRRMPLHYYSKECLFSIDARRKWVDGDRKKVRLLAAAS